MTDRPIDLVVYHGDGCYDGFTAAWIAHKAFPDAIFVPAVHGDPPPDVAGLDVLVLDFAYDRTTTERLHHEADNFRVLDHHKTSKRALEGLSYVTVDVTRSGAGLAWDHLFLYLKRPALVDHVEDQDIFKFKYPETRAYNAALTMFPLTFASWETVAGMRMPEILAIGETAIRAYTSMAEKIARRGGPLTLPGGHECWCSNASPEILTYVAQAVAGFTQLPALSWSWDHARQDVYCSIRSSDGRDISHIAEQFGGGGHAGASGFRLPKPPTMLV